MPADRRPVELDLSAPRRLLVVNAGGAGMSAIATVLAQSGHTVRGVDTNETPFLGRLRALGVEVTVATRAGATIGGGLRAPDAVITSTATPDDHPDVRAARELGIPVAHRGDALAAICASRSVLAVAGTHGKSTTAAMLATILAPEDAGYLVGTTITGFGANAEVGAGADFVVEADESDGTFLRLGAHDAVVTNVEADHLAYWGSADAMVEGYQAFVGGLTGTAVLCLDDPGAAALLDHAPQARTYGTSPGADLVISDVAPAGLGVRFDLHHGRWRGTVEVPAAPGVHNARNAAAAVLAAGLRDVSLADAAERLATFAGVARRFERRGEAAGVTFVDSYDHLPTEVAAALAAARAAPYERVVCVFQPHRYTRTRDLAPTFAEAFRDADVLAVCGLYAAGEQPIAGVSGALVADAVAGADAAHRPGEGPVYLPDLDAVVTWLLATLRPGDLCLTLNAGDLTTVPDRVLAALAGR